MSVHPDIALIGVAKGGTTALATWFEAHAQVAVSRIKEPNFFSRDIQTESFSSAYRHMSPILPESYWAQDPLGHAHQDFVHDSVRYARLFEHAQRGQKSLEASTSYFFSSQAPERLFEANPKADIVLLLRHPVERAFSHYRMARKYGMVQGSFLEALSEDVKQPAAWGKSENFVHLSRYAEGLERWMKIWPSAQFHVRIYEEFFRDESETWAELCQALNLTQEPLPEQTRVFEGQDPAFPGIQRWIMQSPLGRSIKSMLPEWARGRAIKALTTKEALQLSDHDRSEAWAYFEADRIKCESLLGRPLSLWT